ncbi:MAG TPA: 2-hydroxyacid dehydrogenase [Chthoniobacteraceae bacterium]|jgi:D-lactate dehydrogenase
MKVAVFSTKPYDRRFLDAANAEAGHELIFIEERLNSRTAGFAAGAEAACIFVNDEADAGTLEILHRSGTRMLALRSAGFNHVDLKAATKLGMSVRRVPSYSPYAVAEFTLALIFMLNRKTHRAYNRVREGNFALEGLLGFDLHGRTVGVVGTGKIGLLTAKPLGAMGCKLLGYDPYPRAEFEQLGGNYVDLPTLLAQGDIVSLHLPLTPESHHMINRETLKGMKDGVMLINTSRGGLIDAAAVVDALKSGKVGYLGLDVYEQEADVFYEDLSGAIIQDDVLQRLLTFPNVVITSHQAFFTETALHNIAETTIGNLSDFQHGRTSGTEVSAEQAYGSPGK